MRDRWNDPLPEASPVPLWVQIAGRLREAIRHGEFAPGEILPSESQLNEVFRVSRATSRASLNELEREGLIVRRSGKGSIVIRSRVDQPVHEMSGFSEDMRRRGLVPSYETRHAGRVRINREVAEALEVRSNTMAFFSQRLLKADGSPIGVGNSWLAPRLFREVKTPTAEELTNGSLYEWLYNRCGISIRRAREYIEATVIEPVMARDLDVSVGSPLLVARRQSFDESGQPAEYAVLYFRADRYRFQLEITR